MKYLGETNELSDKFPEIVELGMELLAYYSQYTGSFWHPNTCIMYKGVRVVKLNDRYFRGILEKKWPFRPKLL